MDENEINKLENNEKGHPKEKNTNMLLAAFIMFILPIISTFLGALLGGYIGKSLETSNVVPQVIGGIIGFACACLVIKIFDKLSRVDENVEKIHWDDL